MFLHPKYHTLRLLIDWIRSIGILHESCHDLPIQKNVHFDLEWPDTTYRLGHRFYIPFHDRDNLNTLLYIALAWCYPFQKNFVLLYHILLSFKVSCFIIVLFLTGK